MCPFHEKEDVKKEDGGGRISSLALGAFISLIGLAIVLITQNHASDVVIIVLLLFLLFVLISGFYGHGIVQIFKNYFKNRNDNKLAKHHFKIFRNLVIRFKEFTENRGDNIQLVMHDIKNHSFPQLEVLQYPFSQINVIHPKFFQDRYNYYNERLNQFDETKESLVSLAKEFESILFMYDILYIKYPVDNIRQIGRDEVPLQFKESYNKARLKYIDFLNSYKTFAKNANEDLVEKKNDEGFLGTHIIFKDYFDFPEEL